MANKIQAMAEQAAFMFAAEGLESRRHAETIVARLRAFSAENWAELQQRAGYMDRHAPSERTRLGVIAVFSDHVDTQRELAAHRAELTKLEELCDRLRALTRG